MALYPFDFLAALRGQDNDVESPPNDIEQYLRAGKVAQAELMIQTLLLTQLQRRHPNEPQIRKLVEKHVTFVEEAWPKATALVSMSAECSPDQLTDFAHRMVQALDGLLYAPEHVTVVPLMRELEPYLGNEEVALVYVTLQEIHLYLQLPRSIAALSLGAMVRESLQIFDGWPATILAPILADEDLHEDFRALLTKLYA